jgi:hypothetical protein
MERDNADEGGRLTVIWQDEECGDEGAAAHLRETTTLNLTRYVMLILTRISEGTYIE